MLKIEAHHVLFPFLIALVYILMVILYKVFLYIKDIKCFIHEHVFECLVLG